MKLKHKVYYGVGSALVFVALLFEPIGRWLVSLVSWLEK